MKFTQVVTADGATLEAGEGSVMRVRYHTVADGDWIGWKKNTLLTFAEKEGTAIFFGIARCNLDEGDRFNRKRGRAIAASRLQQALKDFSTMAGMKISGNMLYGICPRVNVGDLLRHFKFLDEKIDDARQKVFAEYERLHAERKARGKAEREAAEKKTADKVLGEEAVA